MKLILSLFVLCIICSCSEFKDINKVEDRKLKVLDAIIIQTENFDLESSIYTPEIEIKVYEDLPSKNKEKEIDENKIIFLERRAIRKTPYSITLPEGEYYVEMILRDIRIYPLLTTVYSSVHIYWGYYPDKLGEFKKMELKECVKINRNHFIFNAKKEIVCPILTISDRENLKLSFKQDEIDIYPEGTLAHWILGIALSLKTYSPLGVISPVILGMIAFQKEIQHPILAKKEMTIE
jgi:hypothetical protein